MNNFMKYFIWTVVIGSVFYIGIRFQTNLAEEAQRNFHILPVVIYGTIFPIFMGILLRLPQFINMFKQKGNWKVNWAKLTVIGIPTLYITVAPLLSFTFLGQHLPFIMEIIQLEVTTIAGLIFGYVLLDSLNKY